MTHQQSLTFLNGAINVEGLQYWADLGCGTGTFTKALAELLPTGSHITAVDKEQVPFNSEAISFLRCNFEKDNLELAELDGILIANALHYVSDKRTLIKKLEVLFADVRRFVIIEYDTDKPNLWIPYPIPFEQLKSLFVEMGYDAIEKTAERRSAYGSGNMYCALIQ